MLAKDWTMDNLMFNVLFFLALFSNISTGATSCAIVLGVVFIIGYGVKKHQWPFYDKGLGRAVLLYIFAQCVIAVLSYDPRVSFGDVWATAYRFLPLFFVMAYVKNLRQLRILLLAFAVSVLLTDSKAAYQLLVLHIDRPSGFNNSATFFASHMLMALPILFLMLREKYINGWQRCFVGGVFLFSFFALFACETRGGWVALAGMMLLFGILDKKYRVRVVSGILLVLLFVGGASFVVPSFQARIVSIVNLHHPANRERLLMWQSSLAIIRDYPIHGIGQDEFGVFYNSKYISPLAKERPSTSDPRSGHGHPHNNLLKMTTEGGIIGLVVYLLFYGYLFYRLYQQYRAERDYLPISYALMGMLVFAGIQLEGLTDTNINQVPIMREYWLLMGMLLVGGRICLVSKQQQKSLE